MISYAQNREDVLLNRLFPPGYVGFYLDVGANHPLNGSVTAHFYHARGWRGVNVEPSSIYETLCRERPRDINLNVAVSNRTGDAVLCEFPEATGVSTFDVGLAEFSRQKLQVEYRRRDVRVVTLQSICEKHATNGIDFLSIDVEGHERQVLEGGDWKRFRPRVVLLEATRPHSTEPSHHDWEPLLLSADYLFAAFDGLNRYFVRAEDRALLPLFETPVNTFDDYITATEQRALAQAETLRARLEALEQMGNLTLALSRRINRLESRFPAASRAIHRLFRKKPAGVPKAEFR